MKKKFLAFLLAALMVMTLLPTVAFAGDGDGKTIANILPEDFPASGSNAWVCESDRNKVVYKDDDNSTLTIGSYVSGQFTKEELFN